MVYSTVENEILTTHSRDGEVTIPNSITEIGNSSLIEMFYCDNIDENSDKMDIVWILRY